MQDSRHHRIFVWIGIFYAAVIAVVLYPALHEQLGTKLLLWNCIPPTIGLIVIRQRSTNLGRAWLSRSLLRCLPQV